MPLNQQIRSRYRKRSRIVILTKHLQDRLLVMRQNPVLRLRQHSTRTTGWIAHRHNRTTPRQNIAIRLHQQIHHKLNHLSRREVIPCRLIRRLIKPPNQILKHQPHRDIVHAIGMQIHLRKLSHH